MAKSASKKPRGGQKVLSGGRKRVLVVGDEYFAIREFGKE